LFGGATNLLSGVPLGYYPAWGAFAEHFPFQPISYTQLYQEGLIP